MKNNIRKIIVSCLVLVYCLAINAAGHIPIEQIFEDSQNAKQSTYFSPNTLNLYSSETAESTSNNLPETSNKKFSKKLGQRATIIEHLISSKFNQYTKFSTNFPIRFRKSDIIYPFHYFW